MTALGNAPAHWRRTTIGDVAEVRLGRQRSPKNHAGEFMQPYLRAANVDWYGLRPADIQQMNFTNDEMGTYALRKDDILIVEGSGSATEVGKCALVSEKYAGHAFQNTLIRVRPDATVDSRWLMYRINADAELGGFLKLARGSGIFHLGSTRTSKWPIAVPPLAEQHVIVAAIERMLSKLSAAEGALATSGRRLLKLHDSSLRQAVYGEWPGTLQSRHAVPAAWPRAGKGVSTPEAPEDIALPLGWRWAALDQIAEIQSGAAKSRKLDGADDCVERPYLSVANVQRGHLQLDDVGTMWVKKSKLDALTLQSGDILFNEGGDKDKLGRGWIWEGQISGCVHQNHVFRARLLTEDIDPRWVSHWGNIFGRWWFYARGNQTTGIASINKTVLRALPVAIPPRDVQQQLLEQIDKSASLVAAVREALHASETRAAALRRSILKAAFEGRLSHHASDTPLQDLEQVPA